MKSTFRSLIAAAAMCMVAIYVSVFDRVAISVSAVATAFKSFVLDGLNQFGGEGLGRPQAKALVAAKSFVARIIKRERPQIHSQWRMCPSI